MLALAVAAILADCVPARWFSGDPKSLDLLKGSPINCLVVEPPNSTEALIRESRRRGIRIIARGGDAVVTPGPREGMRPAHGVAATAEAVWPGIRIDDETTAGPTAAPWIDTNLGFLRYMRSRLEASLWLCNLPPPGKLLSGRRYQQAIADAALAGAHWVLSPDPALARGLLAGEPEAGKDWTGIVSLLRFISSLPDVRALEPFSRLGVSVGRSTGAFISGGVLDMIGSQHIPFRVASNGAGLDRFFDFADDSIVKFPKNSLGRLSMLPDDVADLEHVYRRVQVIVGRTNFGLRVFNGSGMLSAPYLLPNGKSVLVLLTNYTDYPVEQITLHVRGRFLSATLTCPGCTASTLATYPVGDATAIEIPSLTLFGAVRAE